MNPPAKKTVRVLGHPKGDRAPEVELIPGQRFVPMPADPNLGRLLVFKLVHVGDNHYKAVAQAHDWMMPITEQNIRQLGLGVSRKTLYRLVNAGFIKGGLISPSRGCIDINSYYEHVARCMEDPNYWEDPKRRSRYLEAKALVL